MYRIVTNTSLNHVQRWHAHQTQVDGDLPEVVEPARSGPESSAIRRKKVDEVLAALAELPPKYRAALTLRHMQELSYQEVADTLSVPLGTVKTPLHWARAALRARLVARRPRTGAS